MSTAVLLDAGPLGLVTSRWGRSEVDECRRWLGSLLEAGTAVHVPAIADYEVRRELVRAGKTAGLGRLDALVAKLGYLPLTREAMLEAAQLWALTRRQGRPTAADASLDADCVLAGQALTLRAGAIVATTNVGHLGRLVDARYWRDIPPLPIDSHPRARSVLPFNLMPLSREGDPEGVTEDVQILIGGQPVTLHLVRGFLVAYTDNEGVLWGPGLTADLSVDGEAGNTVVLRFR